MITRLGKQTWKLGDGAGILAGAAVCGPREGEGPLVNYFDRVFPDLRMDQTSFEKAEQYMEENALRLAMGKAELCAARIDLLFAGDLINQITPSAFTARNANIPFCGLFSACATFGEALALAAFSVCSGIAGTAAALSGSHTCSAERQFRYPNEYASQKPPCSQSTVTAAGAAILTAGGAPVRIAAVTVGRVVDEQVTDPFQMGAAMAPAFAATVLTHLRESKTSVADYDAVISGDLGRIGQDIAADILSMQGIAVDRDRFRDCGLLLCGGSDQLFSGGSGCGCAAAVTAGYLYQKLKSGELRRILLCPTGALLSPLTVQQKESIPAICHALVLEGGR